MQECFHASTFCDISTPPRMCVVNMLNICPALLRQRHNLFKRSPENATQSRVQFRKRHIVVQRVCLRMCGRACAKSLDTHVGPATSQSIDKLFDEYLGVEKSLLSGIGNSSVNHSDLETQLGPLRRQIAKHLALGRSIGFSPVDTGECRARIRAHLHG